MSISSNNTSMDTGDRESKDFSFDKIKAVIDKHPDLITTTVVPIENSYWTLLHMAADTSNEELLNYLVQKETIHVNKEISPYGTALHVAAAKPNLRIIQNLILHGADVNCHRSNDNWVPLCCAIDAQIPENVSLILGMRGDINPNIRHMELGPLHIAVSKNDEDMIEFLVNESANLEATSEHNSTALCYAVEKGNSRMVQFLLEQHADVNTCSLLPDSTLFGLKPLHLAVIYNKLDVVQALLCNHANVNAVTTDIQTPLHLAIIHRSHEVISELLSAGADINIVNDYDKRPLDECINGDNNKEVRRILKQHAVKLLAANFDLHPNVFKHLSSNPKWNNYYDKCCEQIEKMKTTNIGDTCFMYYYLMFKSTHQLSIYARNTTFVAAACQVILEKEFPEYADIMRRRLRMAEIRRNLVMNVEDFIWENLNMLPSIFVRKLFYYFSNRDMEILGKNLSGQVSISFGHWGYNSENRVVH